MGAKRDNEHPSLVMSDALIIKLGKVLYLFL
jgi:hypothetical protein